MLARSRHASRVLWRPCCDDVVKQSFSLNLDSLSSVRASTKRCMWCRDMGLGPPPIPQTLLARSRHASWALLGPCCDDVVKQFVSLDLDSLSSVRASTERCMWCRDKGLGPPPNPQTMLAGSRHASRVLWRPCCDDVVKQSISLDLDSLSSVRASTDRCMWCRDKGLEPPPNPQTMLARSRHASRAFWRPCCDDVVKQSFSLDLDSLSSVRASTDKCMWCRDKGLEPPPIPQTMLARSRNASGAL